MQDDGVTPKYRCYNPEAAAKVKPIKAVEKLIGSSTPKSTLQMSKTAGPKGFGIKRESSDGDYNRTGNHLLDKLRRNKMAIANSSYKNNGGLTIDTNQQPSVSDYGETLDTSLLTGANAHGGRHRNNTAHTSMKEKHGNPIDPKSLFKIGRSGVPQTSMGNRGTSIGEIGPATTLNKTMT